VTTSGKTQRGRLFNQSEEDRFRSAYTDAVESECGREVLIEVARRVQSQLLVQEPQDDTTASTWTLQTDASPPQAFMFRSSAIVTIGQPGYQNDVVLSHEGGEPVCSRVHVVIIPLNGQLVLCDVGSASGFRIQRKTAEGNVKILTASILSVPGEDVSSPKVEGGVAVGRGVDSEGRDASSPRQVEGADVSQPGHRRPLLMGVDETAVLLLEPTGRRIVLNPKECVICLDAPRDTIFDCGHHVCCASCSCLIRNCPVCRMHIKKGTVIFSTRIDSYIP